MFTSRAEYRLSLREDNADLRLTEIGRDLGLVDDYRWGEFNRKRDAIAKEQERLRNTWMRPQGVGADHAQRVLGKPLEREYRLADLLRRPEVGYEALMSLPGAAENRLDAQNEAQAIEQVEIAAKYFGYIERQREDVERSQSNETMRLPTDMDYNGVHGLSIEVKQKLNQQRPETLGQAARMQGMTPAAVSLLLVHLKRQLSAGEKKRA
jgi:tRNA uridine 5-carboxymethylaminomethyl modification enzyme